MLFLFEFYSNDIVFQKIKNRSLNRIIYNYNKIINIMIIFSD